MQQETVMRPLRFIWGWIYVGLAVVVALFNAWATYQSSKQAALTTTLIFATVVVLFAVSAIGIAVRRKWGLYFTLVLMVLWAILCAAAVGIMLQNVPLLVEGFILMPAVVMAISFFVYIFYFVYFLRRRALFR